MSGIGFVWFWKNDAGSWTPYPDEHQDAIERARIQGEDHVILQIGPNQTPYLIDFKDEVQENLEYGHRRLVSRANEFTVWYWRDDDGVTWNLYDPEHADTLTRAESEKEPEVYLVINETLYRIDLPRRLQINFDNHAGNNTREIRQGRSNIISNDYNNHNNASSSTPPGTTHPMDDETAPVIDTEMEAVAPKPFLCPISFHIMSDPVTTFVGSTYDRENIQWWLKDHQTDPLTKRPIPDKLLVPNNAMKESIEEWKLDYHKIFLSQQKKSFAAKQQPTAASKEDYFCKNTLKVVFVGQNKMGTTSIVQKLVHGNGNASADSSAAAASTKGGPNTNAKTTVPGLEIHHVRHDKQLQLNLWDFQGHDCLVSYRSMGFTPQSLFVIVWDMGASNPTVSGSGDDDDRALVKDIHDKVQVWVDRIREQVPEAVILPVASFGDGFQISSSPQGASRQQQRGSIRLAATEKEAKRRCQVLKAHLRAGTTTILYDQEDDPVLRVSVSSSASTGVDGLMRKLFDLGSSNSGLFDHIGRSHSVACGAIRRAVQELKGEGNWLIDVETLVRSLGEARIPTGEMGPALQWVSNIGEILHFPTLPKPFDKLVALDSVWLFQLLGCILRHDWKRLVSDGRRRIGRDPPKSFGGAVNENCAVISKEDASMLWFNHLATTKDMHSLSTETVKGFLQTVMVHYGVLVPVDQDLGPLSSSNLYPPEFVSAAPRYIPPVTPQSQDSSYLSADLLFIPNLLIKGDHGDGLNDVSLVAGSTTRLAQKVQFQGEVPDRLMEKVMVALLRNITIRLKGNETNDHACSIALERVLCWRTLFRIRFALKSSKNGHGSQGDTTVEVCSQLVDSSRGMGDNQGNNTCLFTSANIIKGDSVRRIWEAGYGLVLETIQAVVEGHQGLQFATSVFCHDCLASRGIHGSQSWTMDEIDAASKDVIKELTCRSGHTASLDLLIDTGADAVDPQESSVLDPKLKQAIVLVGLYDARERTNKVRRFGSGVVVDAARGLIVTAARNVMKIDGGERFGSNYDGILGGKVVIGVLPSIESEEAVFRYYAKIVSKDPALTDPSCRICRIDACVLKITSRFECDVENANNCCDEIEMLLRDNARKIAAQRLISLPTQTKSNLEDRVQIFGFEQNDSSVVNRRLSSVLGYICQKKSTTPSDIQCTYQPSRITIVMANAKPGHVGGPCLNQQGEVVGILACGDPDEESRSYVTPVSEWEGLVMQT